MALGYLQIPLVRMVQLGLVDLLDLVAHLYQGLRPDHRVQGFLLDP